jgi:acetylcholinesterase
LTYDEDCLYLNVVRPAGVSEGDDLPVALWIYGGA